MIDGWPPPDDWMDGPDSRTQAMHRSYKLTYMYNEIQIFAVRYYRYTRYAMNQREIY